MRFRYCNGLADSILMRPGFRDNFRKLWATNGSAGRGIGYLFPTSLAEGSIQIEAFDLSQDGCFE
mgnify:CR=1 FL=1